MSWFFESKWMNYGIEIGADIPDGLIGLIWKQISRGLQILKVELFPTTMFSCLPHMVHDTLA